MKILDVGCGRNKYNGKSEDEVVGVDLVKLPGINVVCDLEKFPWPFKKDEFEMVIANHVIEHMNDTLKTMEELWRITKNGSIININVPYFTHSCAFDDPTHKRFFTLLTFVYFTNICGFDYYTKARFELIENKLNFDYAFPGFGIINKILNYLFNGKKSKYLYQAFISHIIPAKELCVKLRRIK